MQRKGFWIGWLITANMVLVSGVAFVDTAHPVTSAVSQPDELSCPTGMRGVPSTCAEVHATALAAGSMSRSNYELAQSFIALSAHTSTP